jgi:hypothetical protein
LLKSSFGLIYPQLIIIWIYARNRLALPHAAAQIHADLAHAPHNLRPQNHPVFGCECARRGYRARDFGVSRSCNPNLTRWIGTFRNSRGWTVVAARGERDRTDAEDPKAQPTRD